MAQQFSRTDQRRITFLSLLSSAAQAEPENAYGQAGTWLAMMEEDGFFEAGDTRPTREASPGRSGTSRPQASSSRPSNRGRDRQPFNGRIQNPDAPATEKQAGLITRLTDDYTFQEILDDFTKQQASDLIEELQG